MIRGIAGDHTAARISESMDAGELTADEGKRCAPRSPRWIQPCGNPPCRTPMPAWRQFDNREVSDLLTWLRSWQPVQSKREEILARAGTQTNSVGAALYRSRCTVCHGERGEGKIGPSLNNPSVLPIVSNEFLADTIVRGRPGTAMPAWHSLSSDDVADLITLLRGWQQQPPRELARANLQGDWQHGEMLFEGMCASCHGPHGVGALGPQLGNPVFLDTVSDAQLVHWISYGRQGTQMRPFLRGQQGANLLHLPGGSQGPPLLFSRGVPRPPTQPPAATDPPTAAEAADSLQLKAHSSQLTAKSSS